MEKINLNCFGRGKIKFRDVLRRGLGRDSKEGVTRNDIAIVGLLQPTQFEESEKYLFGDLRLLPPERWRHGQYIPVICYRRQQAGGNILLEVSMEMWVKNLAHFLNSENNRTLWPYCVASEVCVSLTHWGRVTQVCVFTLQLCKTDDANLRF